jgi:hypothetical protein
MSRRSDMSTRRAATAPATWATWMGLAGVLGHLAACAGSEVDVTRTAADPAVVGPAPSPGSGVLRQGFNPSSLGPPAMTGGTDPHAGHKMGASSEHGAAPADPHAGHGGAAPADPHAGHKMGSPPVGTSSAAPDPHAGHGVPPNASAAPPAPPASAPAKVPPTGAPARPTQPKTPPTTSAPARPVPSSPPAAMPPGHDMSRRDQAPEDGS